MTDHPTDAALVLALLARREPGKSPASIVEWVLDAGTPQQAWEGREVKTLTGELEDEHLLEVACEQMLEWASRGIEVTAFTDSSYPEALLTVFDLPPVIWTRGSLTSRDVAVSVVGTRNPSEWGREFARSVAGGLVESGVTVISGLADGVDTEAHRAALAAGGRTVATIGTGLDHTYPKSNRELQQQIGSAGLVLSQFRPEQGPTKWTFPLRNATMSGYACASVIVEASEHSGTRIQGRVALAHGRPVILTSVVADTTVWGRELTERPGVHVVASAADAVDCALRMAQLDQPALEKLLA